MDIMSAVVAYAQSMSVINERNAKERKAAENYLTAAFTPMLHEAINDGRTMLMLRPSSEVNSWMVSEILREHGYRTRVSNSRRPNGASIQVYWNCEEDDDE